MYLLLCLGILYSIYTPDKLENAFYTPTNLPIFPLHCHLLLTKTFQQVSCLDWENDYPPPLPPLLVNAFLMQLHNDHITNGYKGDNNS